MAYTSSAQADSFPIGGAIAQYIFVTIEAVTGNVVASAADGDAIGVCLEAVSAAQFSGGKTSVAVALIQSGGKCMVKVAASAVVAVGDKVGAGANGECVPTNAGMAQLGVALELASNDAAQEIITILFDKSARLGT
jgi:hypothetical protein